MTRWHVVCALLRTPERESRRLARLLERLPAARRVHQIEGERKRANG